MIDLNQYQHCIYHVHPVTIEAVVKNESHFNPLALHVNGLKTSPPQPKTQHEAVKQANRYIKQGYSVDIGLMQINSKNLNAFGITVNQAFTPCTNIHLGSKILYRSYQRALKINKAPNVAFKIALSYYNTGHPYRGFRNGYVDKYIHAPTTHPFLTASAKAKQITSFYFTSPDS